jgi:SAM-dependent methyltransferase
MIGRMTATCILKDQIDYYRARAAEYDEWWFRGGRYDRGAELNARWHADTAAVDAALVDWLDKRKPRDVLELACGTGLFTRRLAPRTGHVTALDASSEVVAINRARVGGGNVEYIEADLFTWRPARRYDLVFFSFWLSHVPPDRFDAFWDMVKQALEPGGAAYLIDSAFDRTSTAKDHVLPGQGDAVVTRRLNDGREFRIVKLFYEPVDLSERLRRIGWNAALDCTANYFIYGSASPHPAVAS